MPPQEPPHAPSSRPLAAGEGWSAAEFICRLGPHDRPFEERYRGPTVAAVVAGTFQCRTDSGTALLHPGAFLLGNAGACFECGHEHGVGDRCISFHFDQALFEEIAATAAGSSRFRFRAPMLPASARTAQPILASALAAAGHGHGAGEEVAIGLAEAVLRAASGGTPEPVRTSARDLKRVTRALRYVEENSEEPLGLPELAAVASMSKYHFLRTFRRIVGMTPYRYVLATRMRKAALRLGTGAQPIAAVAFEAGFGDLSTFNARFRSVFGATPRELRRAASLG